MHRSNDIKGLKKGVVTYTCMYYTHPGGPQERITEFPCALGKCDREKELSEA